MALVVRRGILDDRPSEGPFDLTPEGLAQRLHHEAPIIFREDGLEAFVSWWYSGSNSAITTSMAAFSSSENTIFGIATSFYQGMRVRPLHSYLVGHGGGGKVRRHVLTTWTIRDSGCSARK